MVMMMIVLVLLLQFISSINCAPEFLVHPQSTAAIDGTTVVFTSVVTGTDSIRYRVNGSSASLTSIQQKGFNQLDYDILDNGSLGRNLSVIVRTKYNNTEIHSEADGSGGSLDVDSNTALLTIQGPLDGVPDLSHYFIDSSTVNISWSPPFTLPGTSITGYNISATAIYSNGSITLDYFSMETHYTLRLTDVLCYNTFTITVSGYNGLDGKFSDPLLLSFEPSIVTPIDVNISEDLQLSLIFNAGSLISGPSQASLVSDNSGSDILTANPAIDIDEDQQYTVVATLSNQGGAYSINSTVSFNTAGVESVNNIYTSNGSVCLECVFAVFSTDTGCTVELVSTTLIHTDTITRPSNISTSAVGCVPVTYGGVYHIRVYAEGGSIPVPAGLVTVITSTSTSVSSVGGYNTSTIESTSGYMYGEYSSFTIAPSLPKSSAKPSESSPNTIIIAVSVPVVAVIVTIAILVLLTIGVIMFKRRTKESKVVKGINNEDCPADIMELSGMMVAEITSVNGPNHGSGNPVYSEINILQKPNNTTTTIVTNNMDNLQLSPNPSYMDPKQVTVTDCHSNSNNDPRLSPNPLYMDLKQVTSARVDHLGNSNLQLSPNPSYMDPKQVLVKGAGHHGNNDTAHSSSIVTVSANPCYETVYQ